MNTTEFSFVICTHNGERWIREVLEACLAQETGRSYEIVVVDNNSTDGTQALLKAIAKKAPDNVRVRIVSEYRQGLVFARHKGVAEATGAVLSFIDDDNLVSASWLETCVSFFENDVDEIYGAVGGLNRARTDTRPGWFEPLQAYFGCGPQLSASGMLPWYRPFLFGAGITVRRKVLLEILEPPLILTGRKGQSLVSGEDSEITLRMMIRGHRLFYLDDLELDHVIDSERLAVAYRNRLITNVSASQWVHVAYLLHYLGCLKLYGRMACFLFAFGIVLSTPIRFVRTLWRTGTASSEPFYRAKGFVKGYLLYLGRFREIKRCVRAFETERKDAGDLTCQ